MSKASSYCSSLINRKNLRDPVTLVRSPTLTKLLCAEIFKGSSPLSFMRLEVYVG